MATIFLSEPGRPQRPATFEAPEAMLLECHQRVHRMCALLHKLCAHAGQHGADAQAQQAAQDIMRYFDMAAPHHHEDEERHIFPRMLASGHAAQIDCARTLQAQHVQMAALWQHVRSLLEQVKAGNASALLSSHLPADFVALYSAHIALEESSAYPPVFAHVTPPEALHMGKEMAARRMTPHAAPGSVDKA